MLNADPLTRSALYTPASGQRYDWTEGQTFLQTTTDTYSTSAWLGISAFYSPSNIVNSTTQNIGGLTLQPGAYISNDSSTSNFTFSGEQYITSSNTQYGPVQTDSTWYGKTTYTQTTTTETGYEDVYMSSIKASEPINVTFKGSDTGGVTVTSQGSVIVEGTIQDAAGATSITSSGGQIETGGTGSVGGHNIDLTASSGIGVGTSLNVNLTDPNDTGLGVLTATSTTGDIALIDPSGSMNIGTITDLPDRGRRHAQGGGEHLRRLFRSALGGRLLASQSLLSGGAITLTATGGNIGTFGTSGTFDNPALDALPIYLDTGSDTTHDTLTATAAGNVYVRELTGDLRVNDITTPGDVRVEVPNGNLTNANTNVVTDTRTWNQLLNMYTQMEATGTAAQDSINNTINAYEAGQTQDYQTYWTYRNQQSDDYVGGLTQGQTYYAVVDGTTGLIRLSTTDPTQGAPTYAAVTASNDPGAGGAEQRLYLGSTSTYVTFDSSSSTIDSTAGTINPTGVSGGTLVNGEQVTFERYVPYSDSQTVTLSAVSLRPTRHTTPRRRTTAPLRT